MPASAHRSMAGSHTGVYIGASSVDYAARFIADPSVADVHMMTGNSLSIMANRISYTLDLRGPEHHGRYRLLVVAGRAHLAAEAIRKRHHRHRDRRRRQPAPLALLLRRLLARVDAVADRALPALRCRGRRLRARRRRDRGRAALDGGRAQGAQPHPRRDRRLRHEPGRPHDRPVAAVRRRRSVGCSSRCTATSASIRATWPSSKRMAPAPGSAIPIEADALGKGLGPASLSAAADRLGEVQHRPSRAGLGPGRPAEVDPGARSTASCRRRCISKRPAPTSRSTSSTSGWSTATGACRERRGQRLAGVNSFGFGGTNAHVVLRSDDASRQRRAFAPANATPPPLLLSAHSPTRRCRALAAAYDEHWPADMRVADEFIGASAHLRDPLAASRWSSAARPPKRSGTTSSDFAARRSRAGDRAPGRRSAASCPIAFLFSGNGSQWAGMGRAAWHANPRSARRCTEIDGHFAKAAEVVARRPAVRRRLGAEAAARDLSPSRCCSRCRSRPSRALEDSGVTPAGDARSQRRRNRCGVGRRCA